MFWYCLAYTTYVRFILEFNSVIWLSYLKKDVIKMESGQKQFIIFVSICKHCNLHLFSYSN